MRTVDLHSIASFSSGLVLNLVEWIPARWGYRSVSYQQYFFPSMEG
jgi:hypothetical protein